MSAIRFYPERGVSPPLGGVVVTHWMVLMDADGGTYRQTIEGDQREKIAHRWMNGDFTGAKFIKHDDRTNSPTA